MAKRFNIHSTVQAKLHREYKNLLRRTTKFRSNYIEVGTGVSSSLEQARHYLGLTKLTQKDVAAIKKLTKTVHSMRGSKLKESYVEKKPVEFTRPKSIPINHEDIVMLNIEYWELIIDNYRDFLERICTSNFGDVYYKDASHGKGRGLHSLLDELRKDILNKGYEEVAKAIIKYKPGLTDKGWAYDSEVQFDFLARIGMGEFDIEPEFSDEEAEGYY